MKNFLHTLVFLIVASCQQDIKKDKTSISKQENWQQILEDRLPEYGHRNWIIIADAAYPKQSSPGIETVYTNADQVKVIKHVLEKIDNTKHIQPVIMFDKELQFVSKKNAPGVEEYKSDLKKILDGSSIKELPHNEIIKKLDKTSELFNILLLKTNLTIPYTSIFIELDCGYWNATKENELRALIKD